jgi:hypothetical protein
MSARPTTQKNAKANPKGQQMTKPVKPGKGNNAISKKITKPLRIFSDDDWKNFEQLCSIQCTKDEICSFFKLDDVTLDRLLMEHYEKGFSEIFRDKRNFGKVSLRRAQFQTAIGTKDHPGSERMQKHLGINWLGQTDKVEVNLGDPTRVVFEKIAEKLTKGLTPEALESLAFRKPDIPGEESKDDADE